MPFSIHKMNAIEENPQWLLCIFCNWMFEKIIDFSYFFRYLLKDEWSSWIPNESNVLLKFEKMDCINDSKTLMILFVRLYLELVVSCNKRMSLQFALNFLCSAIGSSFCSHLCKETPQKAQVTISPNPR